MEENQVGKNIRFFRKTANLTQRELAEKLGIGYSVVSKYESGAITPPEEKLAAIAKIFDVSEETLLGDESPAAKEAANSGQAKKEQQEVKEKKEEVISKGKEAPKASSFSKDAAFCETFRPESFLKRKMSSYRGMIINGCICTGGNIPLYVPAMYLPIEAYRSWLRAVYPEYSIAEKPFAVNSFGEDRYITAEVQIFRVPGDPSPFTAVGIARVDPKRSFANNVKFARADAIKRAMVNQGFGDGLNWEAIQKDLPVFTGTNLDEDGNPHAFMEYVGEVICNGEIVRPAKTNGAIKPRMIAGVVDYEERNSEELVAASMPAAPLMNIPNQSSAEEHLEMPEMPSEEKAPTSPILAAILKHNQEIAAQMEEDEDDDF